LKKQFDRRHRVCELPVLDDNTPVYISSGRNTSTTPGSVVQSTGQHSYQVQTPTGTSRCNRSHLRERPVESEIETSRTRDRSAILTRSKTGTTDFIGEM